MVDAQRPVARVDDHADRVEADGVGDRPRARRLSQPRGGEPAQSQALARAQSRQRILVGTDASLPSPHPTRLDLGEDERRPVEGDQVDLAIARAKVSCQNGEAEPLQAPLGELLAEAAESAASVDLAATVRRCLGAVGGHMPTLQRACETPLA